MSYHQLNMNHKKTIVISVICLIVLLGYGYNEWLESKKLSAYLSNDMIAKFSPGQDINDVHEVPDGYVPQEQVTYPTINEVSEFKSELGGFSFTAPKNNTSRWDLPTEIVLREEYEDEIFFYQIDNSNFLRVQAIKKESTDTLDVWLENHFEQALESVENIKMVEIAGYQALQFDITGALDGAELYAGKGSSVDSVRDNFPPFPIFSYSLYTGNTKIKDEVTLSTRYIVIDVGDRFLLASYWTWQSAEVVDGAENVLKTLKVF